MSDMTSEDAATTSTLNKSTLALHANTVLSSALGFGFLILAARLYEREEFGRDMALVTSMMFIAAVAETNLGMTLTRFLPQLGQRSSKAVRSALLLTGVIAALLATAFVLVAPHVSKELRWIDGSNGLAVWFVVASVCWTIYAVSDAILAAVRSASWIPVKNGVFGVAKIAAMAAFAAAGVHNGVFLAWVIPLAILSMPLLLGVFVGPLRRHQRQAASADGTQTSSVGNVLSSRRALAKYLGYDYLASIMTQIGTTALPIIVVAKLGADANADFAVAFSIVTAVEQLALNAGVALTVEGAFDEASFARLLRHSFFRFGALLLGVIAVGIIGAPVVAMVLGGEYGHDITTILRLLLVGLVAEGIIILFESSSRIRTTPERIVIANLTQATITIAAAVVLSGPMGLAGIGVAWILGHGVVAVAVLPSLIRQMRAGRPATA